MAEDGIIDSFGFGSFNVSVIVDKVYFFVGLVFLAIIIGAVIGGVYVLWHRKNKSFTTKKIGWWHDVNGSMHPGKMEDAEEIVIPGTTLRVFYVKSRDLWLPSFSRAVSDNLYYVMITPTKQLINFTLSRLTEDLRRANLDYDHTDSLWAAENTREYIKRNYKDKSLKWWQVYQGVLTSGAYILLITFSMVIIIYFLRGIVQDIGGVANTLASAMDAIEVSRKTSGLVVAG